VQEEDDEVLQWILEQHVHPEQQNALGLQPIHAAALHGKADAVLQLCRAGVDVNAVTDGNVSPTLQQLVSFHTDDPYIMGVAGSTPLHLALYTRQVISHALVAVFIGSGADLTAANWRGSTPISVLFDWQSFYCPSDPLHHSSLRVWRQVLAAVVAKFGLLTLTLGARQAVSPQRWALVSRMLAEDGAHMNHVPSLKTFCWLNIRSKLGGRHFLHKVNTLPLPAKVRHYLTVL
jgi:hypothetical protein